MYVWPVVFSRHTKTGTADTKVTEITGSRNLWPHCTLLRFADVPILHASTCYVYVFFLHFFFYPELRFGNSVNDESATKLLLSLFSLVFPFLYCGLPSPITGLSISFHSSSPFFSSHISFFFCIKTKRRVDFHWNIIKS